MKKLLALSLIVFIVVAATACGNKTEINDGPREDIAAPNDIDLSRANGEIAVDLIEIMNDYLYERVAFTTREYMAAEWIYQTLDKWGFDDVEMQTFSMDSVRHVMEQWGFVPGSLEVGAMFGNHERRNYSQNIILTLPGQSSRTIIVGAHYDTVLVPGASDNASGVALLMESALRMREIEHYYTIVYVFFGAEEMGLLGAYYYYESLSMVERDNIKLMINADVLFEGENFIWAASSSEFAMVEEYDPLVTEIAQIADEFNRGAYDDNIYEEMIIFVEMALLLSTDHWIFWQNGHSVLNLAGMHYRGDGEGMLGNWDMRVWHSERDCFHYINARWPGKIGSAMYVFVGFLNAVLVEL